MRGKRRGRRKVESWSMCIDHNVYMYILFYVILQEHVIVIYYWVSVYNNYIIPIFVSLSWGTFVQSYIGQHV